MSGESSLGLFQGYGVELEYMIVDRRTLEVRPITDQLFHSVTRTYTSEVERGDVDWSNELALHLVELKGARPFPEITGCAEAFHRNIGELNRLLAPMDAMLLPGAAHPWMNPKTDMRLWPHDNSPIYAAFDRIFNCRGHGWANLQSCHLNLPFANDDEFGRLHAAVRLLLPILPALAASSPLLDGRFAGALDARLREYQHNCEKIPSITGFVIPEPVFTKADYEKKILGRIYDDLRAHDPDGTLCEEWVNARGAIARFERNTIEIRVLDVQECPLADLAIMDLVVRCLQRLVGERWQSFEEQCRFETGELADILDSTIALAENAVIDNARYLTALGSSASALSAGELWADLLGRVGAPGETRRAIDVIVRKGTLATRILRALDGDFSRPAIADVYTELAGCLAASTPFGA
jgi:glutamate---cysteine ligase / carboxylate-amine ligase